MTKSPHRIELDRALDALVFELPAWLRVDLAKAVRAAFDAEAAHVRDECAEIVRTTHVELGDHLGGHRGLSSDREALAAAIISKGDR